MSHADPNPQPRRRRRKLLLVPIAVGGALATGFAFAAWTSGGTGTGSAKAQVAVESVISPTVGSADLYPGATGAMTVSVSNPNPYPVIVTSLSSGSSAVVNTSCAAGTVTSDARSDAAGLAQAGGSTTKIAAGGSGSYDLVTHMGVDAHNACQGQTFTLGLTAEISSAAD